MTQGVLDQQFAGTASPTSSTTKYVHFFGEGKADGNGRIKDVLGGKGAGSAEMTNAGLPVPPGFHDSDRGLSRIHARRAESTDRRGDARGVGQAREPAEPEARHGRESTARLCPLRRKVLDARHVGHDPEPRPQRQGSGSAGKAQQQSAFRV
jgi:hypothetical protein